MLPGLRNGHRGSMEMKQSTNEGREQARTARRKFLAKLCGAAAATAAGASGAGGATPPKLEIATKPLREADFYKPHNLAG